MGVMREQTGALDVMVMAVTDDWATAVGIIISPGQSRWAYAKSLKGAYSITEAILLPTRCKFPKKKKKLYVGTKYGKDIANELKNRI